MAYQQYVYKQLVSKILNGGYNRTNGVNFYCKLDDALLKDMDLTSHEFHKKKTCSEAS